MTLSAPQVATGPVLSGRTYPLHAVSGRTLPVHYWLLALKWSFWIMGGALTIYAVEKWVLGLKGTPWRMVSNPAEFSVRIVGFAHYSIATYLLVTSKRLRSLKSVATLFLFVGLAVGLCYAFYLAGGRDNKLALISVYFFFFMHALRDEVFFYRQRSGPAISDAEYAHVYRTLIWFQVMGLCLLGAILYPVYASLYTGPDYPAGARMMNAVFPAAWPQAARLGALIAPFLLGALISGRHIQRTYSDGVLGLLKSHPPLTFITLGTVVLAYSAVLVGGWVINVVILTHFVGWIVFTVNAIRRQPIQAQRSVTWRTPDQWFRRNLVGFAVFHGGLALLFFALIAWNHWGLAQTRMSVQGMAVANPLSLLFGKSALLYGTIAHVTLAFVPLSKPARR
jgi:hypothetical protein